MLDQASRRPPIDPRDLVAAAEAESAVLALGHTVGAAVSSERLR